MIAGEPMVGISTNGTSRLADDGAGVFDGEQRARLAAGRAGFVAEQGRRRREGDAQHDRDGQHDEQREPNRACERLDRLARVERLGLADDEHEPEQHQRRDHDLGQRPAAASGSREPRADEVEEQARRSRSR